MSSGAMNILVVDDDSANIVSIKVVLKSMGHTVEVLKDGADALTRLTEQPDHYHILITDHAMCNVSGQELLAQLKSTAFKGRIIVLSGYMTLELEAKYRELGADKIIRKPFDLDEMRNAVEELRSLPASNTAQ